MAKHPITGKSTGIKLASGLKSSNGDTSQSSNGGIPKPAKKTRKK